MQNVKTISFGGMGNADLASQNLELERRQQYIDALRKQALTPLQAPQAGAQMAAISPWEGLAKLGVAYFTKKGQDENDAKQTELGTQAAMRSAAALRALAPAGTFDGGDSPLNAQPQASVPGQAQPSQVPDALKEAWRRAIAVQAQNPELGTKLIEKLAELTPDQKDMAAQGIDPRLYGAARMAKEKAGGLVNVAPNNTVLDAGTNQPIFAAPDFANGRSNSFGANGQPQMGAMQGSEIIPQQAGAIEQAKQQAQAQNDMVTINTPQGPRMVTRAQAVGMTKGQPQPAPQQGSPAPNQGFPPGTQMPQPTPGMQSRADILNQELAAAKADPRRAGDVPLIQRELAGLQGSGSMPGIPLQSPADLARQVGQVNNDLAVERSRIENAQSPENQQKIVDAQGVVGLASQARKILEQGQATGSLGGVLRDKVTGAVGMSTKASQASAQLAALGGALVSKQPKMSGPQSDKDVLLYKEMAGRIGDASVPIGDRLSALQVIESLNQKYVDQQQRSVAGKALDANRAGAGTLSPDDLVKKYLGGK